MKTSFSKLDCTGCINGRLVYSDMVFNNNNKEPNYRYKCTLCGLETILEKKQN